MTAQDIQEEIEPQSQEPMEEGKEDSPKEGANGERRGRAQ